MSKPTLYFCILTKGEICGTTTLCLIEALKNEKLNELVKPEYIICIGQSDLPKARSSSLSNWYINAKLGDFFMFIDADQIFTPQDIISAVRYAETHDVVCGTYPRSNGLLASVPKDLPSFYENNGGELYYGATGLMLMNYAIVDKLAKTMELVDYSTENYAYPFFFEIIAKEQKIFGDKPIWLGEDFSFCKKIRNLGGNIYGFITQTMGHIVVSNRYVNKPDSLIWPDKTIAIYCQATSEPWSAANKESGIGGSELAVINLTTYWAQKGYQSHVFCNCDTPGSYNGVIYHPSSSFRFTDKFNILIIWRALDLLKLVDIQAKKLFVDLHDVVHKDHLNERGIKQINKVCFKSQYHRSFLPNLPEEKVMIIPNGGYVETESKIEKDLNYLIYTSSYDRGLLYMLKWGWPRIKKACPNAYLKIFYGWDLFDKMQPKTEEVASYKREMTRLMSQDGITECGRVPNEKILKEKELANIHWYTGTWPEIDCISIRESASLGAVPVVSWEQKVFQEKPYCITIDGDPKTQEMQERAADKVIELLQNPELCREQRERMKLEPETWDSTAQKWLEMFKE